MKMSFLARKGHLVDFQVLENIIHCMPLDTYVCWKIILLISQLKHISPSIIETRNSVPLNRKQRKTAWWAASFYLYLRFIICSRATRQIKVHCQGIHFNVVNLYCILCIDIALFTQIFRCLVLAGKCSCRKKQPLN